MKTGELILPGLLAVCISAIAFMYTYTNYFL
jgi:hypothetical protein